MKKLLVLILAAVLALSVLGCGKESSLNTDAVYFADIVIEDYGTITVELDAKAAPITVANFVKLAREGFYEGTTFHRIIEGFMMQGGAPKGNSRKPDTITGEFSANGHENPLTHTRGTISMARAIDMNSASSQFFIVHEDSPHLNGQYAAFGKVVSGMDVVDAVCESADPVDMNGSIAPDNQPVIRSVTIREQ